MMARKTRSRDAGRPAPRHLDQPAQATLLSATSGERVSEAMAGFPRGGRLMTLSLGQWDKTDWIEGMCRIIGQPERLMVSTWTAKPEHVERVSRLCPDTRWLLDPTMRTRESEVVASIVATVGASHVAMLPNHAKFVLAEGDGWYLSSTTSSNLNMNPRTEVYTLEDGEPMYRFLEAFYGDCKRWGADLDEAEYKALSVAKTEAVERRAAQMGVPTMQGLFESAQRARP